MMKRCEMKVVRFTEDDVIAASFRISGFGNSNPNDGQLRYINSDYDYNRLKEENGIYSFLDGKFGHGSINESTPLVYNNTTFSDLGKMWDNWGKEDESNSEYNGWYVWNPNDGNFIKQ